MVSMQRVFTTSTVLPTLFLLVNASRLARWTTWAGSVDFLDWSITVRFTNASLSLSAGLVVLKSFSVSINVGFVFGEFGISEVRT